LLNGFMQHLFEIKAELGDSFEAEMWDKGWTKVYETIPMETFDEAYVDRVTARLAQVIACADHLTAEIMRRPRVTEPSLCGLHIARSLRAPIPRMFPGVSVWCCFLEPLGEGRRPSCACGP
jgi:hypothetical protein